MRKDIRNTSIVPPIVHKPRNTKHKTFGENVIHGDFTFNNEDYAKASRLVRVFGHSKFIRMFWRLFFPMLIYGIVTALVPILFMTMAKGVYEKDGIGIPIYESFSYTLSKFNYINIFVALAWTLMAYPIVGNYIGRNQVQKMQESVRFIFYMIMITCSIAMICEFIYAPMIAQNIVWKYKDASSYDLNILKNHSLNFASKEALQTYLTDIQRGYQLKYSTISIRFFAFTSYLVGWASLFTPMFSSKRNNKVLIFATVSGLIFFLIVYSSYIYTDVISAKEVEGTYNVAGVKVVEKTSYSGYAKFNSLIQTSCGIYIVYNIVIPLVLTIYCIFPKQFKIIKIKTLNFLKNCYNSLVDKQSNIEYQISKIRYKKYQLEQKIEYYDDYVAFLKRMNEQRAVNQIYSQQEIARLNAKNSAKIAKYENIIINNKNNWLNLVDKYDERINQLETQLQNTKATNKKLFYIDYNALENVDDFEKGYLWFNGNYSSLQITAFKKWLITKLHIHLWDNRQYQFFTFKISAECAKNVWKTSAGLFINQFAYGVFGLTLVIFATNFNGNLLGIPGSDLDAGKEYFKLIVANASLISGYLGMVYNGFVLLPQYFVAYYLGRGDKETAYHNSLFLMNWSFIVGLILCCIVLIYASFINYIIYPSTDANALIPVRWTGPAVHGLITYKQFWLDCFYIELILAIVEIFDAGTTLSFNILATGGCKWTFFSDQFIRLANIVALIALYYGKTDAVHWFNYSYSANMFIYYIIARSHSVIPAFISWIFIERGLALRSMPKEDSDELTNEILGKNRFKIRLNNDLNKKSKIYID